MCAGSSHKVIHTSRILFAFTIGAVHCVINDNYVKVLKQVLGKSYKKCLTFVNGQLI